MCRLTSRNRSRVDFLPKLRNVTLINITIQLHRSVHCPYGTMKRRRPTSAGGGSSEISNFQTGDACPQRVDSEDLPAAGGNARRRAGTHCITPPHARKSAGPDRLADDSRERLMPAPGTREAEAFTSPSSPALAPGRGGKYPVSRVPYPYGQKTRARRDGGRRMSRRAQRSRSG
ncbi:hypothetical protein B0H17DRAFT_1132988 [Mycena rosella]|uniref:Uncharacterized protein n=1 Tax=Mycena rosella TaxID=1033263 RepID=A0AAD7DJC5_MYCRO|nr:hypothetical protein B0H17DRAFT_1132988 [Mycena rosella]